MKTEEKKGEEMFYEQRFTLEDDHQREIATLGLVFSDHEPRQILWSLTTPGYGEIWRHEGRLGSWFNLAAMNTAVIKHYMTSSEGVKIQRVAHGWDKGIDDILQRREVRNHVDGYTSA